MEILSLRFVHLVGVIALGAGLCGAFVADLRSRQSRDVGHISEACRYERIFYGLLVVPGAITIGISGLLLVSRLDLGFFDHPWLTGMWVLFVFEFVEGNTVTRVFFRRVRLAAADALDSGVMTERLHRGLHGGWGTFTHTLDLPLYLVMVSLGVMRPATWSHFVVSVGLSLAVATALTVTLRRTYGGRPLGLEAERDA